jgi:hypothetical protein
MCVRYYQGEAMEKTLAWAEGESKASCGAERGIRAATAASIARAAARRRYLPHTGAGGRRPRRRECRRPF